MPYPIDETFATGIPAGFGQVGGNGSGFSAAHNASQEAVDLTFGQNQSFWHLLQAEFSSDFWVEFDIELVSKAIGQWHFGFWLYSNQSTNNTGNYEGHRYAYNYTAAGQPHQWQRSSWNNGGGEYNGLLDGAYIDNWPAAGAGQRRTLRLDARRTTLGAANWWVFRITVGDVVVMYEYRKDGASLRPAVFAYGLTIRLHQVRADLGSAITLAELPTNAAKPHMDADHLHIARDVPPARAGIRRASEHDMGRHHHLFSGNGKVIGTVKQKPSIPVWRRVVLLDEKSNTIFRETWSDPATGAYSFDQVALGRRYTVMSFDHTGAFRAVIADSLQAVPR